MTFLNEHQFHQTKLFGKRFWPNSWPKQNNFEHYHILTTNILFNNQLADTLTIVIVTSSESKVGCLIAVGCGFSPYGGCIIECGPPVHCYK